MDVALHFTITIIACIIGAISGIGGGIIIKPSFDALTSLSVPTITFLSCCASFTMATFAMIRCDKKILTQNITVNIKLAFGAVFGGIIGKMIFQICLKQINNDNLVGLIQAIIIFVITLFIFINLVFLKNKHTYSVTNTFLVLIIGFSLGVISSFLGIGGGPLNIIILYIAFSASPKTAAIMSLFIIMFSQASTLISSFASHNIPPLNIITLVAMLVAAISGAIIGKFIFKKINEKQQALFFLYVLVLILIINIYNIIKFSIIL